MPIVIRGATALLCVALAVFYAALDDIRFALAAAAIVGLAEIALALRARPRTRPGHGHASEIAAARVSYTEQDGVQAVTLSGADKGHYVVLSRTLRAAGKPTAHDGGPCLELSPPRGPIDATILDAYLSPRILRLVLDARGAQVLGSEKVCVALPPGTDQRLLERALSRILHGVPFTSNRSMPEDEADIPSRIAS